MRCIALAQGFQRMTQVKTFCLTNQYLEKYEPLLMDSGMEVITFPENQRGLDFELADYMEVPSQCITLFDHYDVTYEQMLTYQKKYPRLIAIDDLADRRFKIDLIINSSLAAPNLDYQTDHKPTLLLGNTYILLRNNLLQTNREPQKSRIFMSFGGGDVIDRVRSFLQMFPAIERELTEKIRIDFICDSDPEQLESIRPLLNKFDHITVRFVSQSYDLSTLMAQADFAITAGGSTVFELAYLGVPQLILMIAENQEAIGQKVNEQGFGKCPGYLWDLEEADFVKLFFEFLRNQTMKQKMARLGNEFIDGKGVIRVVEEICQRYCLTS